MSLRKDAGPQIGHRKSNSNLSHTKKEPYLAYHVVLSIALTTGLISTLYSTIPDCDEVFNYWEPTHYLSYGSGLQTWEYSPIYAIRSWLYVGLHSLITLPFSLYSGIDKTHIFFILRSILAGFAAFTQTEVYDALSRFISPELGVLFAFISVTSAGMFQAMPAYLPSSFAMSFVMLGMTEFVKSSGSLLKGLTFFSIAGFLGWPFCLALVLPQLSYWAYEAGKNRGITTMVFYGLRSAIGPVLVLALVTTIDSLGYRKIVIVPLNIVLYNVFGGSEKGPDLYGTEPWWYYIVNLALNFNVMTVAALLSGPLLVLAAVLRSHISSHQVVLQFPFYMWLAIFTLQPHKEERFMFPAYPALCINAATSLHLVRGLMSDIVLRIRPQAIQTARSLGTLITAAAVVGSAFISASRSIAVITAYRAPMDIYTSRQNITGNVCFGKEWYRFPSSYFLPDGARARFIKSEFAGLLPGSFTESNDSFREGTWRIPQNMNDLNQEDFTKYVSLDECDYIVDSFFKGREESSLEPNYILDTENWETVMCREFLDASKTPIIGRVFWLPPLIYRDQRVWGSYCLLKKRDL